MTLRYVVLGLSYVAIIVWAIYLARCRGKWLYALAPLLWLINVAGLWTFRLFIYQPGSDIEMINEWSLGIYFHGLITLIGAGVIAIREEFKKC